MIFARNFKDLIEGMYEGYTQLLHQQNLKQKDIFDEVKRFNLDNNQILDSIKCDDYNDSQLNFAKRIQKMNLILFTLDQNNYKSLINKILSQIQKIVLLMSNNCSNAMDYLMYFKSQADDYKYIYKKGFHNPWLFSQLHSSANRYMATLGKYRKMGLYLGHIMSWFKVYDNENIRKKWKKSGKSKNINLKRIKS